MEDNKFADIVKNVCRNISGKEKRGEVEAEIKGHLEDTFQRFKAMGRSDEDAINEAVAALGDLDSMRQRLGAVHSFSNARTVSVSLWMYIICFLFLKISVFDYFGLSEIRIFIAAIIEFVSLFILRTVNKKLNRAFYSSAAGFAVLSVFKCLKTFIYAKIADTLFTLALSVLTAVSFYCFFSGLREMYIKFRDDGKKKIRFELPMILLPLGAVIGGIVTVSVGPINIQSFILSAILLIFYIFVIIQIIRLTGRLWDADKEYGILPPNAKAVTSAVSFALVCIIIPIGLMYASSTKPPELSELVIHDTENSAEAEEVREYIRKDLEMECEPDSRPPEGDFLDELPDSEILKLKNTEWLQWTALVNEGFVCHIYDFCSHDREHGGTTVRSIYRLEPKNGKSINKYRGAVYYYTDGSYLLPLDEPDYYISALYRKNGKLYADKTNVTGFIKKSYDDDFRNTELFKFSQANNPVIYFSVSSHYNSGDSWSCSGLYYITQKFPILLTNSSMDDYAAFIKTQNAFDSFITYNETFGSPDLTFSFSFISDANVIEAPTQSND